MRPTSLQWPQFFFDHMPCIARRPRGAAAVSLQKSVFDIALAHCRNVVRTEPTKSNGARPIANCTSCQEGVIPARRVNRTEKYTGNDEADSEKSSSTERCTGASIQPRSPCRQRRSWRNERSWPINDVFLYYSICVIAGVRTDIIITWTVHSRSREGCFSLSQPCVILHKWWGL